MGVDVDKSRGDDAAGRVDLSAGRGAGGEFSERNDAIAADGEIAGDGGRAGAIDERRAADDEVVVLSAGNDGAE